LNRQSQYKNNLILKLKIKSNQKTIIKFKTRCNLAKLLSLKPAQASKSRKTMTPTPAPITAQSLQNPIIVSSLQRTDKAASVLPPNPAINTRLKGSSKFNNATIAGKLIQLDTAIDPTRGLRTVKIGITTITGEMTIVATLALGTTTRTTTTIATSSGTVNHSVTQAITSPEVLQETQASTSNAKTTQRSGASSHSSSSSALTGRARNACRTIEMRMCEIMMCASSKTLKARLTKDMRNGVPTIGITAITTANIATDSSPSITTTTAKFRRMGKPTTIMSGLMTGREAMATIVSMVPAGRHRNGIIPSKRVDRHRLRSNSDTSSSSTSNEGHVVVIEAHNLGVQATEITDVTSVRATAVARSITTLVTNSQEGRLTRLLLYALSPRKTVATNWLSLPDQNALGTKTGKESNEMMC